MTVPISIHDSADCVRVGPQHYHYRSWSDRFECLICHRAARFNLNFLGQRRVVCDGVKFSRIPQPPRTP